MMHVSLKKKVFTAVFAGLAAVVMMAAPNMNVSAADMKGQPGGQAGQVNAAQQNVKKDAKQDAKKDTKQNVKQDEKQDGKKDNKGNAKNDKNDNKPGQTIDNQGQAGNKGQVKASR